MKSIWISIAAAFTLALSALFSPASAQRPIFQRPLELIVPYSFSRLEAMVQRAEIHCTVYNTVTPPDSGSSGSSDRIGSRTGGALSALLNQVGKGKAAISLAGRSEAKGTVVVRIDMREPGGAAPRDLTPRSYECHPMLGDRSRLIGVTRNSSGWAKPAPGSVLTVKGTIR